MVYARRVGSMNQCIVCKREVNTVILNGNADSPQGNGICFECEDSKLYINRMLKKRRDNAK